MPPFKASITPRILLLFMDIRSTGFSKLFRNKSNKINLVKPEEVSFESPNIKRKMGQEVIAKDPSILYYFL